MTEDTKKVAATEDESLSDDQLKEVSGGSDSEKLGRENSETTTPRWQQLREENLEKR